MSINEAILSFTNWDRPWEFEDAVRSLLNENDMILFDAAWAAALDERNWRDSDLVRCGEIAHARVRDTFPMLHEEAIDGIVRGASYQWK
jgi:hypothetical protein